MRAVSFLWSFSLFTNFHSYSIPCYNASPSSNNVDDLPIDGLNDVFASAVYGHIVPPLDHTLVAALAKPLDGPLEDALEDIGIL